MELLVLMNQINTIRAYFQINGILTERKSIKMNKYTHKNTLVHLSRPVTNGDKYHLICLSQIQYSMRT